MSIIKNPFSLFPVKPFQRIHCHSNSLSVHLLDLIRIIAVIQFNKIICQKLLCLLLCRFLIKLFYPLKNRGYSLQFSKIKHIFIFHINPIRIIINHNALLTFIQSDIISQSNPLLHHNVMFKDSLKKINIFLVGTNVFYLHSFYFTCLRIIRTSKMILKQLDTKTPC